MGKSAKKEKKMAANIKKGRDGHDSKHGANSHSSGMQERGKQGMAGLGGMGQGSGSIADKFKASKKGSDTFTMSPNYAVKVYHS